MSEFLELPKFFVTVDRVLYASHLTAFAHHGYSFVYFITIHNETDLTITIKGRKWVVHNGYGEITAVEGEGVVGQSPELSPGQSFSYNSFHVMVTSHGYAEGSYLGIDNLNRKMIARIPRFLMDVSMTGEVPPGMKGI